MANRSRLVAAALVLLAAAARGQDGALGAIELEVDPNDPVLGYRNVAMKARLDWQAEEKLLLAEIEQLRPCDTLIEIRLKSLSISANTYHNAVRKYHQRGGELMRERIARLRLSAREAANPTNYTEQLESMRKTLEKAEKDRADLDNLTETPAKQEAIDQSDSNIRSLRARIKNMESEAADAAAAAERNRAFLALLAAQENAILIVELADAENERLVKRYYNAIQDRKNLACVTGNRRSEN